MPLPFLKAAPVDGGISLAAGERHVASASGVKHFHAPIGTPIAPHPHMPKYAQHALGIHHEGKQVGFIAKLPGPMKKSTGKTHAIFDIHGNKVSHANGLEEGKTHLQIKGIIPKESSTPKVEKKTAAQVHAESKVLKEKVAGIGAPSLVPEQKAGIGSPQLHDLPKGAPKTEDDLSKLMKRSPGDTFSNGEKVPGTGSGGGQWYDDGKGNAYFLKGYKSDPHSFNEVAGALAYKQAGVGAQDVSLVKMNDGKVRALAHYKTGLTALTPGNVTAGDQAKARKGFGVDALLSHHDVFGLPSDPSGRNLFKDAQGNVVRVDLGGTGRFRATGGVKNEEHWSTGDWSANPGKATYHTLRTSEQGKLAYGPEHMGKDDINKSLGEAAHFDTEKYKQSMLDAGIGNAFAESQVGVIQSRQKHLKQFGYGTTPQSPPPTKAIRPKEAAKGPVSKAPANILFNEGLEPVHDQEGKHVGFLSKNLDAVPGGPPDAKKFEVFDKQGKMVGETNAKYAAPMFLRGSAEYKQLYGRTEKKPFEQKTNSELLGMSKQEQATHLGQSIKALGSTHPYTKKVLAMVSPEAAQSQQPEAHVTADVKKKAQELAELYSLSEIQDELKSARSPQYKQALQLAGELKKKEIAKGYQGYSLDTLKKMHANEELPPHIHDIIGEAIKQKTGGPKLGPQVPESHTGLTTPVHTGPAKPLPKYAQGGYKHLNHTIAKLPAPMKKSSGHSYAVFDPQGIKIGYAHSYPDAKAIVEGNKPGGKAVGVGKSVAPKGASVNEASASFIDEPTNTVRRATQKDKMSVKQRQSWGYYTDGGYHSMNAGLRKSNLLDPQDKEHVDHLIAAFDAVGFTTTAPQVVHRGTGSHAFFNNPGDVLTMKGFTSTSTNKGSAFGGNKVTIHLPPGVKYLLGTSFEKEIILAPNTKMRVLQVDGQGRVTAFEVIP